MQNVWEKREKFITFCHLLTLNAFELGNYICIAWYEEWFTLDWHPILSCTGCGCEDFWRRILETPCIHTMRVRMATKIVSIKLTWVANHAKSNFFLNHMKLSYVSLSNAIWIYGIFEKFASLSLHSIWYLFFVCCCFYVRMLNSCVAFVVLTLSFSLCVFVCVCFYVMTENYWVKEH